MSTEHEKHEHDPSITTSSTETKRIATANSNGHTIAHSLRPAEPARASGPILRRRPRGLNGMYEYQRGRRLLAQAQRTAQLPFDTHVLVYRQEALDRLLLADAHLKIACYSDERREFEIQATDRREFISLVTLGHASVVGRDVVEAYCFDHSHLALDDGVVLESFDDAELTIRGAGRVDAHGRSRVTVGPDYTNLKLHDDSRAVVHGGCLAAAHDRSELDIEGDALGLLYDDARVTRARRGARIACCTATPVAARRIENFDETVLVAEAEGLSVTEAIFSHASDRFELREASWQSAQTLCC